MLSIGNKKYRNLQEQVGYNTECIQELTEAIDGITLEDKLVIIANDSGTFSESEMTVLNGPLAFISDGSKVWLKQSETASEFVFKAIDIVATEQGGTHYNVGGSKIVVTRATRAYATSDDVIITTYDKTQIDALLSAKASLSGANFTGEITSPSIVETMSGYSATIGTATNWELEKVYIGAVKTGNKLTIVVAMNITKLDATAPDNPIIANVFVPAEVSAKLISTTVGGYDFLSNRVVQFFSSHANYVNVPSFIQKYGNKLSFGLVSTGSLVVNTKYYYRNEVTFLLSDDIAE